MRVGVVLRVIKLITSNTTPTIAKMATKSDVWGFFYEK